MRVESVICDICRARKGENNHWFVGFCDKLSLHVYKQSDIKLSPNLQKDLIDICSESCATKALSRFLGDKNEQV